MGKKPLSSQTKNTEKNSDSRKQRGKIDRTAMFPTAATKLEMPEDYITLLNELKTNIANIFNL